MAHTYGDALHEERAAAAARGQDTEAIDAEIGRVTGKMAEPYDVPEALGSPSAGDELIGAEKPDPMERHAGRTDVKKAGGGSASEQRQSGRAQRGTNAGSKSGSKTEQDKAVESGSGHS